MKKLGQLLILFLVITGQLIAQDSISLLLERESAYQRLSGTVMVVRNGEPLLHQSYGYANYAQNIHNNINTAFDIGSVSKQFTAAGILTLVHQNKIGLQDNINQYLGVNESKKWKKVTIHQLLTHSSGIPSLFQSGEGTDDIFPSDKYISSEKLLKSVSSKKLKFKPGKKYSYSNSGYLILALIIEHVSTKAYGDFMQEEIFDNYGLTNTSFGPKKDNYAIPQFNYHTDLIKQATRFDKSWMLGAGGIYATPSDLAKWLTIVHSDSFLSKELRNTYLSKHVKSRTGHYGYGWDFKTKYNRTIMEHDGTNMGYISYCGYDSESRDAVIFTTNQSYSSFETVSQSEEYIMSLGNKIWEILNGDKVEMLPEIINTTTNSSSYRFEDGFELNLTTDNENNVLIKGIGNYSPSRMIFEHPIISVDTLSTRVLRVAEQLGKKKFRKITDICDKQMKTAVNMGIIKLGLNLITNDLGKIKSIIPYYAANQKGKVRLTGENGIMDIDLYFNDKNELMGIFEGDYSASISTNNLRAYFIEQNKLFMDGFPYGEESAKLTILGDKLIFEQLGREFEAIRLSK